MLNIINILKKSKIYKTHNKGETTRLHKRSIPLNKEWYNSIYSFKKTSTKFLPAVHSYVFKLFKEHFNIINKYLEKKIKSRKYKKMKRSYGNKVWVSTPEIKHINDKLFITIYIYNRLYNFYKMKLNSLEFGWGPNILIDDNRDNKYTTLNQHNKNKIISVRKKIINIRPEYPIYWGTNKKIFENSKNYYVFIIQWLKWDKSKTLENLEFYIKKLIKENKLKSLKASYFFRVVRYNYLINQFKKELTYLKLKQKILFNEYKFNELYLTSIINFLQDIYKKKVVLNIVMLKHYYLNSSILSQMIVSKIISIRNRGNALRPIDIAISPRVPNLSSSKLPRIKGEFNERQNIILNKYSEINKKHDNLNQFLISNNKISKLWSSKYIDNLAISNLENKSLAGIFVKVAGRLTKRYKAQRAISTIRQKGTLKNVYSAHKGFSSVLSRGYTRINVEKTIVHSKVRIGAFGITGWVASY